MADCVQMACAAGSPDEAAMIGRTLVEERLAACVQIMAVHSFYRWQGALQEDAEWLLLIKTTAAAVDRAAERIVALHSYALPEVTVTPIIGGSARYLEWLAVSVDRG